jgi:hypothetical protein
MWSMCYFFINIKIRRMFWDSIQLLEKPVVVIFVWVIFNYKKAVRFKIILNKLNCNYWAFGLLGFQSIGPLDYWAFGLSDLRTIGPSDYWADTWWCILLITVQSLALSAEIYSKCDFRVQGCGLYTMIGSEKLSCVCPPHDRVKSWCGLYTRTRFFLPRFWEKWGADNASMRVI